MECQQEVENTSKKPDEGEPTLGRDDKIIYRRGVGLLLYLIKFLRPDILNAVRELSKVMVGATLGNMKSMLRTIKYVLDTRNKSAELQHK